MTSLIDTTALTIADFAPFVGLDVLVDATPKPLLMRLDSAAPGPALDFGRRAPFNLVFSTPWTTLLVEAIYPVRLGERAAFVHLIPTQTAPGPRRYYHAVFN